MIDEGIGVHQLGIGKANIRVIWAHGGDLFRGEAIAAVRQRIFGGDGGEAGEQLSQLGAMFRHRAVFVMAQGGFK